MGIRLFSIQILEHQKLSRIAQNNYSIHINKISQPRGEIYDRNGLPLAINKHTYSIGFNLNYGKVSREMEKALSAFLNINVKEVSIMLNACKRFTWLTRQAEPHNILPLFKYKKNGLVIVRENSRFYPQAPLLAQIIGCVGTDNQGLSGIEFNFDEHLKSTSKIQKLIKDAKGRIIHISDINNRISADQSRLNLTIDLNLQYIAERELRKGFKKFRPKLAMALIQNPLNGEILALAVYPSFDNNTVPDSIKDLKNMAISSIFEPGSTFKIVTAAAALQEGLAEVDEIINCENGEYEVGGFPIRDFEPHTSLSFKDCLIYSSNIGLAKIGERVGKRLLYKYARDFGFGNFTGIRLPGETRGILRKPDRWSGTSLSRISFGQEIGVTAIQLVGAFSTIANGGVLYEPRIIKNIEVGGKIREYRPLPIRRVISKETSEILIKILQEVVEKGSGTQAKVKGYKVAGKTGTAQKFNTETLTYEENKYVALFAGFVPANDPKLSILVIFDEPHESLYWGGYVAAPVFSSIAESSLSYLNISPDRLRNNEVN